ncbi:Uncharacterised protein [Mycobacteroides abscessus subsp. abscessus]|nr:Uncharacterised protein [Mycobacteroides abscessus subsp. abscessus]
MMRVESSVGSGPMPTASAITSGTNSTSTTPLLSTTPEIG